MTNRWQRLCSFYALGMVVGMAVVVSFASAARAEIAIETSTIGHGVKAWYVTNPSAPVVDVVLSFEGAGNSTDPEGKAGRAAFAAAMLTEGAGTLDSAAFRRALDERAITLTMEVDEDRLRVHIYCLREHAVRAGELLAMAITTPLLAEADQQRIKSDITSLLTRLNERPGYQAERLLLARAFKGHPYANATYGNPESVARLSTQDIKDYLATYVSRGNILISASGDLDASLLEDMLEPLLDQLPSNEAGAVSITQTTLQGSGETLRKTMPVPQSTILFAAPAIPRDDGRFYAVYILNQILGGNALFSRLGQEVRRDKGLVYGIDTDLDIRRGTNLIRGSLATRNASTEEALRAVKSVLQALRDRGVTTEECNDAKQYAIGSFARRLDSNSSITNLLLSIQVHKLGQDYFAKREDYFGSVSCADINAAAELLLDPSRFLFAVVGGAPELSDPGPIPSTPPIHSDVR